MNFSNLKTLARAYIPGAKDTAITNETLAIILNEGALDIAVRLKCLKNFDYFDAQADVASYRLSQKLDYYLCLDDSGVWMKNGSIYQEMDPETTKSLDEKFRSWRSDEGEIANRYAMLGDLFIPHPIVNTNISDGFLAYYCERPQTMVENSDYPFHVHGTKTVERSDLAILSDSVLMYAEWKILKILSKRDDSAQKFNEYLADLEIKRPLINSRLDVGHGRKVKFGGPRM